MIPIIDVASDSIMGSRKEQQDTIQILKGDQTCLAILCDGMGGVQYGAQASRIAVQTMEKLAKTSLNHGDSIPLFFKRAVDEMDEAVCFFSKTNGSVGAAGTTVVSVVIVQDQMYWLSVGDSRLYICRDGELICATRDHNVRFTLDYLLKNKKIEIERYQKESEEKGDRLTSYIGMGGISFYDISQNSFLLQPGDTIMLASDGLYKTVEETVICCVLGSGKDAKSMTHDLIQSVEQKNNVNQDNTSLIVIRVKENQLCSR